MPWCSRLHFALTCCSSWNILDGWLSGSVVCRFLVRVPWPRYNAVAGAVPKWLREQSAKLRFSGSNPLGASIVQTGPGDGVNDEGEEQDLSGGRGLRVPGVDGQCRVGRDKTNFVTGQGSEARRMYQQGC